MNGKLKIKKIEKPNPAENCDHDTKHMVDLLAGEISDKDRENLSARLSACEKCRDELHALSRAWRLTGETLKAEHLIEGENKNEGKTTEPNAPGALPLEKETGEEEQTSTPEKTRKTKSNAETAERKKRKSGGRKNALLPFLAKYDGKNLKSNTKVWEIAACFAVFGIVAIIIGFVSKNKFSANYASKHENALSASRGKRTLDIGNNFDAETSKNAPVTIKASAVRKGFTPWLKQHQTASGAWKTPNGKESDTLTALALLAFLSHGETPTSKQNGTTVLKAIKRLVNSNVNSTNTETDDIAPELPIKTYAIAEAYSCTKIPMLKSVVKKYKDKLLEKQNPDGSFNGQNPFLYTIWSGIALKSLFSANMENGDAPIERAIDKLLPYLKRQAKETVSPEEAAMTACVLQKLGAGQSREAIRAMKIATRNMKSLTDIDKPEKPGFLVALLANNAFFDATSGRGAQWRKWDKAFLRKLIEKQNSDGSFDVATSYAYNPERKLGKPYATAMASMATEVYYRYIPTFKLREGGRRKTATPTPSSVEPDAVSPSQPPPSKETAKFLLDSKLGGGKACGGRVSLETSAPPPPPSGKMAKSLPEAREKYGRSVALKCVVNLPAPREKMERSGGKRKDISAGSAPGRADKKTKESSTLRCEEEPEDDTAGEAEYETGAEYGDADFFCLEEEPIEDLADEKTDESEKFADVLLADGHVKGYSSTTYRETTTNARLENAERQATKNALEKTNITHMEWEDATLPTVIAELNKYAKKAGVVIETRGEVKAAIANNEDTEFLLDNSDAQGDKVEADTLGNNTRTITIIFDDLSLDDAIKNICLAGNLKYRVENGKVVIATKNVPLDSLETKLFDVDKKLFDFLGGSENEVKTYFKARGAGQAFEMDGCSMRYDPRTGKLVATSTPKSLERIAGILARASFELKRQKNTKNGLPFLKTEVTPFSTFSIDVDTASYTRCAKTIKNGERPSPDAVRPEEFVNYFDYHYRSPSNGSMFNVVLNAAPNPFRPLNTELRIGVQGKRLGADLKHPSVFTILVDTSGSMANENRLDLVKSSIPMLLNQLRPNDKITLLACGSKTKVILPPTPVERKSKILAAFKSITPRGITNLEQGLVAAYKNAEMNYQAGAFNRVVVFTDGISNISPATAQEVLKQVDYSRKKGITNTIVSVGGDGDDKFLETIADKGDGNYVFIKDSEAATELFEKQFAARFREIARDVKIQVEFNPAFVKAYRQVGYKNRQLSKADFRNDSVDAGEVGSGQSVTALYEMEMTDNPEHATGKTRPTQPVATVRIRYKRADTLEVEEFTFKLTGGMIKKIFEHAPENMKLACVAAEFAENLEYPEVPEIANPATIRAILRPILSGIYMDDAKVKELNEIIRLSK